MNSLTVRPPAQMLEGVVDGQGREDDVALLHVLHRPAGAGLLQSLPGRGRRPQILADVLAEPGAPAHLEDAVVVLGLDAHLLVHLPLAVLGQVAAGDLHGRQPEHAEHVGRVGGELDGVDVAQLLHAPSMVCPATSTSATKSRKLDPHGLGREEVHHQGDGHPVGRAAGHRGLQALHALQEERAGEAPGRLRSVLSCVSAISAHPQHFLGGDDAVLSGLAVEVGAHVVGAWPGPRGRRR